MNNLNNQSFFLYKQSQNQDFFNQNRRSLYQNENIPSSNSKIDNSKIDFTYCFSSEQDTIFNITDYLHQIIDLAILDIHTIIPKLNNLLIQYKSKEQLSQCSLDHKVNLKTIELLENIIYFLSNYSTNGANNCLDQEFYINNLINEYIIALLNIVQELV